jgi:hypothetical protein
MKKFLFLLMAATISIGAFAQGKSQGKGHGKNKHDKHYSKKSDSRYERDDRNDDNDRRWDNQQNRQNQQGGKVAKNIPTPVANAFYRDFPNAGNVTWTKDKGIWTAHLGSGGILNRNGTVSYRSNGQRVDGTYTQRDQRNNYPTNSGSSNGTILDKVLGRN